MNYKLLLNAFVIIVVWTFVWESSSKLSILITVILSFLIIKVIMKSSNKKNITSNDLKANSYVDNMANQTIKKIFNFLLTIGVVSNIIFAIMFPGVGVKIMLIISTFIPILLLVAINIKTIKQIRNKERKLFEIKRTKTFIAESIINIAIFVFLILLAVNSFSGQTYPQIERLKLQYYFDYMLNLECKVKTNRAENINEYFTETQTCPYKVSFYIVDDNTKSYKLYEELKKEVSHNDNVYDSNDYTVNDYQEYYTSGEYYKSVAKYEDTILYIETDKDLAKDAIGMKEDFSYSINNVSSSNNTNIAIIILSLLTLIGLKVFFMIINYKNN